MTPQRARYGPLLASFVLAAALSGAFACAADTSDATAMLHERLSAMASDTGRRASDASANLDVRDLGNAAYTTLLHGGDGAVAQVNLDRAFARQEMNPGSPSYGELPWHTLDRGITDLNIAPFLGQAVAAILSGYASRLPAGYGASLRPHVVALAAAIGRQPVPVTYTNIYLMRAVDLILLGQYLGDGAVENEGRAGLGAWVSETRSAGISEFDSATYYVADLAALSECYRYASAPNDRKTCGAALRYLWTDIAANYMPAAHKLSGPSSREYDFVSGNGDMAYWFEGVGWDDAAQIGHANLYGAYLEDLLTNGGYRPSASLHALAFGPARNVTSTFDTYPGHTRWNWVGKNVSLGCAGGSYGPQDKLLVATFAGGAKSAQMNFLIEKSGVAYGLSSSTQKPEHVSPALGCIERGGAAIATFFVSPALLGATPHGLDTDVIFPRDATLAINGKTVNLDGGDVALKQGDILAVRSGGGVVALRTVRVETLASAPTLTLTTDDKGSARGAAWLRIGNLQPGETASPGTILRESFLIVARDDGSIAAATAEIANAAPQDSLGATQWRVSATFPGGRLEADRSSTNRGAVALGSIDGRAPQRMALGVNDVDLAPDIWADLP